VVSEDLKTTGQETRGLNSRSGFVRKERNYCRWRELNPLLKPIVSLLNVVSCNDVKDITIQLLIKVFVSSKEDMTGKH
jgi:hypothetical protein